MAEDGKDLADRNAPKENPAPRIDITETFAAVMAAKDKPDEIAGVMLAHILERRGMGVLTLSASALTSDSLEDLTGGAIKVVCISVVPPTNLRRTRYLCKKLRSRFPTMKLVIGLWGGSDILELARETLVECKPDSIACNFDEALSAIVSLGNITNPATPVKENQMGVRLMAEAPQRS
jgi:hypothetical protein